MSIRVVERKTKGKVWLVQWEEADGTPRTQTCYSASEAKKVDGRWRDRKERGQNLKAARSSSTTLREWVIWWAANYGGVEVTKVTAKGYLEALNAHVLTNDSRDMGRLELRQLNHSRIQALKARMVSEGRGEPTLHKTLTALRSVLQAAVDEGKLAEHPMARIKIPRGRRMTHVRVAPPIVLEQLRVRMELRDRTFWSLLYIAGLRPGEACRLEVGDYRNGLLYIEDRTKNKVIRTVEVFEPLAADLEEWLASYRPAHEEEPMIPAKRRADGWITPSAYKSWQRGRFRAAIKALVADHAELAWMNGQTPYLGRHSCASLLVRDPNWTDLEAAVHLGHSVQTFRERYSHVIKELKGKPPLPIAEQINRARAEVARGSRGLPARRGVRLERS